MAKGEKGHFKKSTRDKNAAQRAKEAFTKGKKNYIIQNNK